MPKLDLTKEQLQILHEAFVFGCTDRGDMSAQDEAIVEAIDRALTEPDIAHGLSTLRKQADKAVASLTPREREVLVERFGVKLGDKGFGEAVEEALGPSASVEEMNRRSSLAHQALLDLTPDITRAQTTGDLPPATTPRELHERFFGLDRTKDGGTGGGVKERQVLLLTVAERELLIEALRHATHTAQQDSDHANSQTELIGNKEILDACQKSVTDLRALLVRVQELINS